MKLFAGLVRVTSAVPVAAMVVAPLTLMAPDWVMVPPAFTTRAPALVAASSKALVSRKVTALPGAVTARLEKLLPIAFSVTAAPAPASTVVAPVAVTTPPL